MVAIAAGLVAGAVIITSGVLTLMAVARDTPAGAAGGAIVADAFDAPDGSGNPPGGFERTCDAIDAELDRIAQLEIGGAAEMADELHDVAQAIRLAASDSGALRTDIDTLANMYSSMARLMGILDEARYDADQQTSRTIDALAQAFGNYIKVLPTGDFMTAFAPKIADACGTRFVPMKQMESAVLALRDALDDFAQTSLSDDPAFSQFAQLNESLSQLGPGEPASTLNGAFDECKTDESAENFGSNRGCDELHNACKDGYFVACDDLFDATYPGTEYWNIGASCGGRAVLGDYAYAGNCKELSRP